MEIFLEGGRVFVQHVYGDNMNRMVRLFAFYASISDYMICCEKSCDCEICIFEDNKNCPYHDNSANLFDCACVKFECESKIL